MIYASRFVRLRRRTVVLCAACLMLWLTACAGQMPESPEDAPSSPAASTSASTEAPTSAVTATVEQSPATDTPEEEAVVLLPTPTPTPGATATPVDWLTTATVEGDYYVLGNPAAPIRLRDYSDFL